MARKKKKRVKRRSVIRWLFCLASRFINWLCRIVMQHARQNPLLACGLVLFILTFGLVSKNAFFNQPETYHDVFFPTRPVAERRVVRRPDNVPAPGYDADLAALQKKLADLGLYKGNIDGRSGPRTREALKKWLELKRGLMQDDAAVPAAVMDRIGAIIRGDMSLSVSGSGVRK